MHERIATLIEYLRKNNLEFEGAIILSPENRLYLTGFQSSEGCLFVSNQYSCLMVDFRYYEAAKSQVKDIDVVLVNGFEKELNKQILRLNLKSVCVEKEKLTVAEYEKLQNSLHIVFEAKSNLSAVINTMRTVKTKREIENIKKAQAITDLAYRLTLPKIKAGMTEIELVCELEYNLRKLGSERTAFDTICVSGQNTSLPHGTPTKKKIENGDLITLDFGAVVNGYCSDMTRTVALGEVSKKEQLIYETVKEAQRLAIESIKSGAFCDEIDAVARNYIESNGYSGCFGHGLGHSVGINIHEKPSLNPSDKTRLLTNMVVTVEPGIYLPGKCGVRIENMVLVNDMSCEVITGTSTDLIIL